MTEANMENANLGGVVTLAAPYSVILLLDPTHKTVQVPRTLRGKLTAASASCIVVGTVAEDDGRAEITLGGEQQEWNGLELIFRGTLETPGRRLAIVTVQNEVLVESIVASESTRLAVFANDKHEPTRIAVSISQ